MSARSMDHHEAKRLVNEHLRGSGLVASHASRHRDAWVVDYVDPDRPDEPLDGGPKVVTADGTVLSAGSVPGDIDRALMRHSGQVEATDLSPEDEADAFAILDARHPWRGVLPEPVEALRAVGRLRGEGREVYPARGLELTALVLVPFEKVRVVIVGLDPYPAPGHATGLAFSVPRDVRPLPPAIQSIHAALRHDGYAPPDHGDLSGWAAQGVLLLNRALTHEAGTRSGAHLPIWRGYTDQVIRVLSERAERVVFVLWGFEAQKVARLIDTPPRYIVRAPHPSSRGRHREAFKREGTFRAVNDLLAEPVDWARG